AKKTRVEIAGRSVEIIDSGLDDAKAQDVGVLLADEGSDAVQHEKNLKAPRRALITRRGEAIDRPFRQASAQPKGRRARPARPSDNWAHPGTRLGARGAEAGSHSPSRPWADKACRKDYPRR